MREECELRVDSVVITNSPIHHIWTYHIILKIGACQRQWSSTTRQVDKVRRHLSVYSFIENPLSNLKQYWQVFAVATKGITWYCWADPLIHRRSCEVSMLEEEEIVRSNHSSCFKLDTGTFDELILHFIKASTALYTMKSWNHWEADNVKCYKIM